MDINTAIKRVMKTGKVEIGSRSSLNSIKNGEAKLVIISLDCPRNIRNDVMHYSKISEIPVLEYKGTSLELGEVCGKPFMIANLIVLDPGTIKISELLKSK